MDHLRPGSASGGGSVIDLASKNDLSQNRDFSEENKIYGTPPGSFLGTKTSSEVLQSRSTAFNPPPPLPNYLENFSGPAPTRADGENRGLGRPRKNRKNKEFGGPRGGQSVDPTPSNASNSESSVSRLPLSLSPTLENFSDLTTTSFSGHKGGAEKGEKLIKFKTLKG